MLPQHIRHNDNYCIMASRDIQYQHLSSQLVLFQIYTRPKAVHAGSLCTHDLAAMHADAVQTTSAKESLAVVARPMSIHMSMKS